MDSSNDDECDSIDDDDDDDASVCDEEGITEPMSFIDQLAQMQCDGYKTTQQYSSACRTIGLNEKKMMMDYCDDENVTTSSSDNRMK